MIDLVISEIIPIKIKKQVIETKANVYKNKQKVTDLEKHLN